MKQTKGKEGKMEVYAHNNLKGDIHMGSPEKCPICKYNPDKYFKAHIQCQMVCGDGSGKKITKHVENCPVLKL